MILVSEPAIPSTGARKALLSAVRPPVSAAVLALALAAAVAAGFADPGRAAAAAGTGRPGALVVLHDAGSAAEADVPEWLLRMHRPG